MTLASRASSLRWRLPALILALLASIGGAFAWTAYREMRHALRLAADDRVHNAASQLADLLAQSATARVAETRRLAADVAVRHFVATGENPDAALLALRTAQQRSPQAKISLRAQGSGAATRVTGDHVVLERSPEPVDASKTAPVESAGPLQVADGRVFYQTTVAIARSADEADRGSGFLTTERSLTASSGVGLIERLIGSGAVLKLGNAAGDVWTDLVKPVGGPPAVPPGARTVSFVDAANARHLGTAMPIAGTPWQVWVQFTEAPLMQPAATLLRRMLPWTVALVLLGGLAVRLVSARITTPLQQMADAADAMAAGDYSRRISARGSTEIGRLGTAFNIMATRVGESHEALETRVRTRTEELSQSRDALAASNRELEAFSYSVSHDLRAPLRGVDGFSQALLEDCGDRLGPEGHDHLHRIRGAAQHMGRLIDDLLKLARVTRADLHLEPVDLTAMAESTLTGLALAHQERVVDWSVQPGLQATGDSRLLQIAVTNLLENAWKFTGNSDHARIEFGRHDDGGAVPEYFVKDNGAGFDSTYASKLFGAFQRLHHVRDFPGTGIGLATVQRIVRRHGGEVRADGAPGLGATFSFTLRTEAHA
jgi:signal transduction histidine kinase